MEAEPAAAATVFGTAIGGARAYAELLAEAGVVRGLIGPREPQRLWTRHLLNSAVLSTLIPADARVVDVGTGAGLPGIPLALVRPDLRVVLLEPLARRVEFLLEVVEALELAQCEVVRGRAEDVVATVGGADVVVSRAVAPLATLAGWCAPLLRPGGVMLGLKGTTAPAELERDAAAVARSGLIDAEVRIVGADVLPEPTFVVRAVKTWSSRRRAISSR